MKSPFLKNLLFIVFLFVFFSLLIYGYALFIRTKRLYNYAKQNRRGWSGSVFRPDRELGFAPVPGARGAHTFPLGEDIPMRFDRFGFRAPLGAKETEYKRPYVLALGCSLTYGDACLAEDTYPHLVARALGGTELNAGVCSYGLSQMLILARRLVPEFKPEYILVQYSPWLLNRSLKHFAPTRFSFAPNPYFVDLEDGSVALHPPAFRTHPVDLTPWRGSPASLSDYLSFLLRVGLPLYLHDDLNMFLYRIKRTFSVLPPPSRRPELVLKTAYETFRDLASEYNSRLIVVGLGNLAEPVVIPDAIREAGLNVVNSHSVLLSRLPALTKLAYCRAYAHYRGNPPVRVDRHPNPFAHGIIAESILRRIGQAGENREDKEKQNLKP